MFEIKKMANKFEFNSSRKYLLEFIREASASLPQGALVLDAGAGNSPYRSLFSEVNYESADFCKVEKEYSEVNYVCDLTAIPVEDSRYDMVILTQVLEHLPEPKDVLSEIYRVLKPGGKLWLCAPLFYEEHEIPFDFYRYTQFGFKYLLQSTNFTVHRIEWLEGYYGTLSYQLSTAAKALPNHPKHYGRGIIGTATATLIFFFLRPLFLLLAILFARLDIREKYISSGQCKNYAIVAVKENNLLGDT